MTDTITLTDMLGRPYTIGDIVAVANYDSSMRESEVVFLRVIDITDDKGRPNDPYTVKGRPLASSNTYNDNHIGTHTRVRSYVHTHRIMALPGVTEDDLQRHRPSVADPDRPMNHPAPRSDRRKARPCPKP